MSVVGSSEESRKFLKTLNSVRIVDLFSDLLALEGHKQIKITDGPGDSLRDIHSIDKNGNRCLSQSKYHKNINQSISSRELGDLVLGMIKNRYNNGIFITNSKISPPAKRDVLNDYKECKLNIEFIDGQELVKRIFDNVVLKAIWFDGKSIIDVNFALVVPVVARNLEKDRPIQVNGKNSIKINRINVGRTQAQFRFQSTGIDTHVFQQYRPPRRKTISEFKTNEIISTEIVITGDIHLQDIEEIIEKLSQSVIKSCKQQNKLIKHFAVLFGQPFLAPLSGEISGGRIPLKLTDPLTMVYHENEISNEMDWLLPLDNEKWTYPQRFPSSQSNTTQIYSPSLDLCLFLGLISPLSENYKYIIDGVYTFHLKWWEKSIFFLLPDFNSNFWEGILVTPPTNIYDWESGKKLCVWIHPCLKSSLRDGDIEPDQDNEYEPIFSIESEELKLEISNIKKKLKSIGGIEIAPQKARYMIAVVNNEDPFPNKDIMEFNPFMLICDSRSIPSPIDPTSRRIQFSLCWVINSVRKKSQNIGSCFNLLNLHIKKQDYYPFNLYLRLDSDCEQGRNYIIGHFSYLPQINQEKTITLLENMEMNLVDGIKKVEEHIMKNFSITKSTANYWQEEFGINYR
jgi:hypothetical protein